MAINNTYKPDERALGLLSELEQGTIDEGGLEYLKALYQKDPNFAAFYTTWKSALNGKRSQQAGTQRANHSERNSYLQSRNSASGYSSTNRTISPGGFKKSGLDEDSMARRSGTMTDPNFARSMVDFKTRKVKDADGNVTEVLTGVSYGRGKSKRTYNADRLQWIMDRGSAGATLSQADQVVYDAMMQREAKAREAAQGANRIAAEAKAIKDARNMELQKENEKLQRELAKMKYRNQLSAQSAREKSDYAAQSKRNAIDEQNAIIRRQYDIPDDAVISDQGYKDIASGKKKWDYSPSDRKEVERLYEEMSELERSKDFSAEDKALMMEMYNSEIDGFKKKLVDSKEPTTTEQKIAQARANGGYYTNNKDELVVLPESPEERRANAEADRALRRKERLQDANFKRENAERDSFMRFVNAEVKAREKSHNAQEDEAAANYTGEGQYTRKDFDEQKALSESVKRYNLIKGTQPTAEPTTEVLDAYSEDADAYPEEPEWYGGIPAQITQPPATEPIATLEPTADVAPEPAPIPRQSNGNPDWRAKVYGNGNPLISPTEEAPLAEEVTSYGVCPVCGEDLDANGYCPKCGYQAPM